MLVGAFWILAFAVGGVIPFSGTGSQTGGFDWTAAGKVTPLNRKFFLGWLFRQASFMNTWLWYAKVSEFSNITGLRSESQGHGSTGSSSNRCQCGRAGLKCAVPAPSTS